MSLSACGLIALLARVGIVAEAASLAKPLLSSKRASPAVSATPLVQIQQPSMHDRDEALRNSMRSMMADEDADDDVWYGTKPKNGLIQTGDSQGMSLDDEYMKESEQALSSALGPRWNSKTLEENADRTTKAFLNGIASPKALGNLHAMMGTMAAMR